MRPLTGPALEPLGRSLLPAGSFPREYFRRALLGGRLSHAYLFVGPEGSGRRRFARELAQALFCEQGGCGSCPSCLAVEHGNHPAVHVYGVVPGKAAVEIDAVRDLSARVHLRRAGLLVGIIEEADRLGLPAANALLKTLEEPTGEAILILIARSSGAVLPTIVSRCHRIPFSPPPDAGVPVPDLGHGHGTRTLPTPGTGCEDPAADLRGGGTQKLEEILASPRFTAENDPRELLGQLFPQAETAREAMRLLLDELLQKERGLWLAEGGEPGSREDPHGEALGELLELRSDLERNVHPELVLEGVLRLLRGHSI